MSFDSPGSLGTHQLKFCLNSKYADLDSLDQHYATLQPSRTPPSPSPKHPAASSSKYPLESSLTSQPLDREYYELLRQIGDREDLRKRLEREKMSAEEELASLEKKENEVFVGARRQELADLVRKREEMGRQEDQIQKEIRAFEKEQKQQAQAHKLSTDEDYVFREGREAGKLAMQRRLLEEKKREIENGLKAKRREEQKMLEQINSIADQPIYIPDFRKPQGNKNKTEPMEHQPSSSQQPIISQPYEPNIRQTQGHLLKQTLVKTQHPPLEKTNQPNQQKQSQAKGSMASRVSAGSHSEESLIRAGLFAGEEKTLF